MSVHLKAIMTEIQNLEELGGPSPTEYLTILKVVKADIEKRIEAAESGIGEGWEVCDHCGGTRSEFCGKCRGLGLQEMEIENE